jgi:DNA-binding protein HU-beta
MNKTELAKYVKETANLSSLEVASKAVDGFLEAIQGALAKGEDVALTGFGSFTISRRSEREGRNPKTGEPLMIAASKQVKFKPGKALKEGVA